jgi:hypothetical protein
MSIMNARRRNLANVLAAGVAATVLVLTGLCWGRSLCATLRHNWLFHVVPEIKVAWSSPFPWERENEPNAAAPYSITVRPEPDAPFPRLGILQYALARMPMGPRSDVYYWDPTSVVKCLYYDRTLGQIVYQGTRKVTRPDGTPAVTPFTYYAGPEGVALAPDEKLGRFDDPVVNPFSGPTIVYDRGLTRFLAIDWIGQAVRRGPDLPQDGRHRPIQIGTLEKNRQSLRAGFIRKPGREGDGPDGPTARPKPNVIAGPISVTHRTLVLDASGRIDLLDDDTLELTQSEMHLRAPASLCSRGEVATPREVAAYVASPIRSSPPGERGVWTYAGCWVAALSRDGTSARLEVLDPNGRLTASQETVVPQYTWPDAEGTARRKSIPSTEAAYFHLSGAYELTLAQFALESLHPPILQFLSYLGASHFEATTGYSSLFLLPDSFLAMRARDKEGGPGERFFAAMAFMVPALVLVLLLAWRLARDGEKMGLSKNAQTAWITGTVLFGLPAYITYRLTRPKVTLVTCTNCGKSRRPDRDKCHRCGSPWTVPELTPPAWRVLGEPEPAEENSLSREPRADMQVQ